MVIARAGAKVVTAGEMKRLEAEANAGGLTFGAMMERAGRAVAAEVLRCVSPAACRVVVLAGSGNNGGDGLVTARCLHDAGASVTVVLSRERAASDPHLDSLRERGVPCLVAGEALSSAELEAMLAAAGVLVDALLGTGGGLPVHGQVGMLLEALARARSVPRDGPQLLVSVDLPSGVDADTGAADPVSPSADLTITFAHAKRGHFLFPGAGLTGRLVIADIGIPPQLSESLPVSLATGEDMRGLLPVRPLNANKGTFGKALIVAGSINYIGAAALAARAAARAGSGARHPGLSRQPGAGSGGSPAGDHLPSPSRVRTRHHRSRGTPHSSPGCRPVFRDAHRSRPWGASRDPAVRRTEPDRHGGPTGPGCRWPQRDRGTGRLVGGTERFRRADACIPVRWRG